MIILKGATVSDSRFHSPFLPISIPNPYNSKSFAHSNSYSSSTTIKSLAEKDEVEIRVCVNRSCRRHGSRQILDVLSGLAPPHVSVNSCGCLSKCGAGPNLILLPQALFLSHCATPARAAQLMATFAGGDPANNLAALALRNKAEEELDKGNFSHAELLLSQAIDLKPSGGLHVIHKSRSYARLRVGNNTGALEDAKEALTIAPQYPQAYLCQGDAFLVLDEYDAAEKAYAYALQMDPSIRRSKSFKTRIVQLQEKLTATNIGS